MKQYKILVVDDDTAVVNALRDALEQLDIYSASIAMSGKEALKIASIETFDAFLVDQIMPEMSGTEFIIELLKICKDPLIYVITAEDDGIALMAAEKPIEQGGLPIKKYLPKPWPISVFSVDLREDLAERDIKYRLLQSLEEHQSLQREIRNKLSYSQERIFLMQKQQAAMAGAMTVVRAAEHEINNINMGISGYVMKLEKLKKKIVQDLSKTDEDELEKIHTVISDFSIRLNGYSDFIIAFSKRINVPSERILIAELIEDCLTDIKAEMDLSGIRIEKEINDADVEIACHPGEIKHALYQIVKNSVEALQEHGELHIIAFKKDSETIIKIRDNGRGIPKEAAHMVFIPLFTQTKIYGGKGCSIAHRIICDNHKGNIHMESYTSEMIDSGNFPGKNRGTIVTIELPLNRKS